MRAGDQALRTKNVYLERKWGFKFLKATPFSCLRWLTIHDGISTFYLGSLYNFLKQNSEQQV